MKIITVLHSHHLGGAERHALGVMKFLQGQGHDIMFAGPLDSWLGERAKAEGIRVAHLPMHGFFDLPSMLRLARQARRFGADLLHGHLTRGAHYAGIASRISGIPNVATAHSTNAGKHFGRADRIIAVSSAVRDFLLAKGYAAERIDIIHNGLTIPTLPPSARHELRRGLGIAPHEVVFGMVARFVPDKGHDIALRAFAKAGAPGRLLLVGNDGTDWGRAMHRLVEELGLKQHVIFLGERNDVFPALAGMDVYLAPSRREAFSLSLIEAAGMGLPLLGTAVGGNPEIIANNDNGLLLPSENVDAFSDAISRLAYDPALRSEMGLKARAAYTQRFRTESMMSSILETYRKTVEAG